MKTNIIFLIHLFPFIINVYGKHLLSKKEGGGRWRLHEIHPSFKITFALFMLGAVLLLLREVYARETFLNETLYEQFSIEKSDYDVEFEINHFGYLYRLDFEDETRVAYEFFVKTNEDNAYVVTYYGHNSYGDSPLREDEFMTLNEGY